MAKTQPFPEWQPDVSELGTGVSKIITGAVPQADGYGPFPSLVAVFKSLPGVCRGYFYARRADGSIAVFAGTSNRLYLLNNTDLSWIDVSKGGAAYTALLDDRNWSLVQFNDTVVACQIGTTPQAFTLSSSSAFADLGGSPPAASFVAVVGGFLVLTGLLANPRRVQWSDLFGITTWTAGVGLSDFQDLPNLGGATQLSGGDAYGLIFQEEGIRSMVYAPGSPVVFQINVISEQEVLFAPYSIIRAKEKTYFCSASGFKVVVPGGTPQPIGKDRVDATFFRDVDQNSLRLMIGATDPNATRVYWAYKSKGGIAGLFDKMLCFDPAVGKSGRFSLVPMQGEYLTALSQPGLTLEALDPIAPTPLPITSVTNAAGKIRLGFAGGLFNADFNIVGQNFIVVYGVTGVTAANGTWAFTVINANTIELTNSVFSGSYTGGGAVGGSLDALGFSLDNVSRAAVAKLSAVNHNHEVGFFTGPSLEAILETDEKDGEGFYLFLDELKLVSDAAVAFVSIGYRDGPNATIEYSEEFTIDAESRVYPLIEARQFRARVRIPGAATWSYARGVQPNGQQAGPE